LTNPNNSRSNDRNDVNGPITPTRRRQQHQQIPRLRTHIEAASVGISPPRSPRVRLAEQQQQQGYQRGEPQPAELISRPSSSTAPISTSAYSPDDPRLPHRTVQISKHTASSILYALEDALRHPNPFTPDLIEENASMSSLIAEDPSASAGNGRTGRTQVPGTTGSPGGIRGPREIMRERQARERRKAEDTAQEELRIANAKEEDRLLAEARRRSEERRVLAAGAAAQQRVGESTQRGSGGTTGQRVSDNSQRSERERQRIASGERQQEQPLQAVGSGRGGNAARPRPTQIQRPLQPASRTARDEQDVAEAGSSHAGPPPLQGGKESTAMRSSFPHAFERWETLSAHWEGLTSFWIRRLEENSNEINREPISQQLSRQVTDLSAAGANLFHAVVELQRLRASSERKFQRWFFETRAEQERLQENQAMIENSLQQERRERAQAIAEAVEGERERSDFDKRMAEMKRELFISKEEARRAWDELGRREQTERERMIALREGQPVNIGGVQVVPMMQGVPSRRGSAARTGGRAQEMEEPVDESEEAYEQYQRSRRAEPADSFTEEHATHARATSIPTATTTYADYNQAPAVQSSAAISRAYYHQAGDSTGRSEGDQSRPSYGGSEGAMSEDVEEYEIDSEGQFVRDAEGNRIRYRSVIIDDGVDQYNANAARVREEELAYLQQHGQAATSSVENAQGSTTTNPTVRVQPTPTSHPSANVAEPVDYSGGDYGSGPGWEAVPRHHHPTRLSDVLEEDERSRTSASQVSRHGGGRE
ncbi:hypothetical protein BJ878DRAFT_430387, partial [Calycina marina]